jgi:hypothetical protein
MKRKKPPRKRAKERAELRAIEKRVKKDKKELGV